eukprot:11673462-Alexandrium_andersonii.AAC.1
MTEASCRAGGEEESRTGAQTDAQHGLKASWPKFRAALPSRGWCARDALQCAGRRVGSVLLRHAIRHGV